MTFDLAAIRSRFAALERPVIFFDNPGGTQIVDSSLKAIDRYLVEMNANHGGVFATSRQSDSSVNDVRTAMADFLNAARAEEIIFGPNMTTLTFNISRSLARTFQPGDTLVVTHLDHDANISPWLLAAEDRGCRVRWVKYHPEDCTLDMDDLKAALSEKPKLVAIGYASNAVGTIHPMEKIVSMAHQAGALVYVDAVQYAPHGPIDVRRLGCDFLVCSAYKFFGPHLGILYGRYDLLESLFAYRVRPAPELPPGKFETGTSCFELISGLGGALEYIEWLGYTFGESQYETFAKDYKDRPLVYKLGMGAIRDYEHELNQAFLKVLRDIPGLKLYGISNPERVAERVPTFSFTLDGRTPLQIATRMSEAGIYVWNGNFYALAVTESLGLEKHGGLLRVGATHYNTIDEVHRLGEELNRLVKY